jgi:hypothetical protein
MLCRIPVISLIIMTAVALVVIMTTGASAETPAGYVVMPVWNSSLGGHLTTNDMGIYESSIRLSSIDNTIQPGQTVHLKKTVNHFITTLALDLKWYNPKADLSITIFTPTSEQFGPWRDDFDGNIDQRITKDIYNANGIEQGEWEYYVKNWGTEETSYSV